jgi:hypothetical protein
VVQINDNHGDLYSLLRIGDASVVAANDSLFSPKDWKTPGGRSLCVPKTLSTLCDQAVFVDEATGVRLSPDTIPLEIDRFR